MPWLCLIATTLAALVINEVLYDPPGPDSGYEFVELFNPGPDPVALDAFELRFVNGSDPTSVDVVWRGDPTAALGPGAFFVVGEEQVPERDRTATLGLQNGDEALVLARAGLPVDVVAWGEDLGLGEGGAVEGGHSTSIGRVPDGADSGNNRVDLRALPSPTPGAANLPAEQFALAEWWTDPVWREDAGSLVLHTRVVAIGWRAQQLGQVEVWGRTEHLAAAPGDTTHFEFLREVVPGAVDVGIVLRGGSAIAEVGPARVWCGVSDLVLTEVQPRPVDGEPEWVEILNRGAGPVDLEGWALRDRGGAQRLLGTGVVVARGERLVFTSDARRLRDLHPGLAATCLEPSGGWPTLNDTDPGGGVAADSLHLIAPGGEVVDLVTWRRADIDDRGRSLQRSSIEHGRRSLWLPSVDAASPGAEGAGERRQWPSGGMICRPDPFTPDGDGDRDVLEILLAQGSVRAITVFDLQGDLVRELEVVVAGDRAVARWDGTDARGRSVPAGAWVVVAETTEPPRFQRRVVGLGRNR